MNSKDLSIDDLHVRMFRQVQSVGPTLAMSRTADSVLVASTGEAMAHRLAKARLEERHSWWMPTICSLGYLQGLLEKAVADKDYVSIINYAAMLRMREAIDKTT